MRPVIQSAAALRRELSARNLHRAESLPHEATYGTIRSVVYSEDDTGLHGNFLPASYRRIRAHPDWQQRLTKAYTANARVPRSADRRRNELDCAVSSDALLMNIFCYPRILARPQLCALLGVEPNLRPEFGVRANLDMRNREVDRTEIDMRLASSSGSLLFEAKLTEGDFQTASLNRLERYIALHEVFDIDALPRTARGIHGYQLIRGVLAAHATQSRFILLCDYRRADLEEHWFRVLRAVRSFDLRSRMALLTWQEIAAASPQPVRTFLSSKYGIDAAP